MRKKLASRALCGLAAVGTLLMTGCSRLPTVTLDQLMEEANTAHQAVDNDGLKKKFIQRKPVDESGELIDNGGEYFTAIADLEDFDRNRMLTREQMVEDVTYLFDALYAGYGNYDQMGGQAAFDAAEQAILEECQQYDSLNVLDFFKLLVPHFSFVKDAHFQIQGQRTNPDWYPFYFRETAFYLEDGQYIAENHKTVASVDGYEDLTELFKCSISPEGEIVYYPVVLQDGATCEETLTVHYTDGSTQVLQCEPYDYGEQFENVDQEAIPEVCYDSGIPVARINSMQGETVGDWYEGFQESAKVLGNSQISILDLRFNGGGQGEVAVEWLKDYAKTVVPSNALFFSAFSGVQRSSARDLWVSNDNLLVILTSKCTASAAEWLIDAAYNLENVLVVGDNTSGAMVGSMAYVQLKNSKLIIGIGSMENIIPDTNDYFEEFRGFCPDLWVPADEAEELAVKLLEQNAQ